jgi:hypothetical protein
MSGARKQIDVARLKADVTAASVELLSAHCATDRVRLQYSPQDIVAYGERNSLRLRLYTASFHKSRPTSKAQQTQIHRANFGLRACGRLAAGGKPALHRSTSLHG